MPRVRGHRLNRSAPRLAPGHGEEGPMSDLALLNAARNQLAVVVAAEDGGAYLGWWRAWSAQTGVGRDDLIDLTKEFGLPWETADGL